MHRFFVSPETVAAGQIVLHGPIAHQICRVLRMRPGERVVLLDGSGQEFETELSLVRPERIEGQVLERRAARSEPCVRLCLYQAMLKANRFEFVLQKGTELGVAEFIPLITERAVVSRAGAIRKKRERWERIIREAAEQSGRGRLPGLRDPMPFDRACAHIRQSGGLFAMPWEEARLGGGVALKTLLRQPDASSVHLIIGPEGGLTPAEAQMARDHGIPWVTMGSRVLRAETAALAAAVIVLHEMGDLE